MKKKNTYVQRRCITPTNLFFQENEILYKSWKEDIREAELLLEQNGQLQIIPYPPSHLFKKEKINSFFGLKDGSIGVVVRQIFSKKDNTSVIGLYRFDGKKWTVLNPAWEKEKSNFPFPKSNQVFTTQNKDGSIILNLGSSNNINTFIDFDADFKSYQVFHFPSSSMSWYIKKDQAGTYWIPTASGLKRVFPWFRHFSGNMENMFSDVHAISEDDFGKMWFGSYTQGLVTYDGRKIQLPPKEITSFKKVLPGSHLDKNGNMYFSIENPAGYRGVLQFNGKSKHKLLLPNIVGFYFSENANGDLMYGSSKNGVFFKEKNSANFDESDKTRIDKNKGLKLLNVLTVTHDAKYKRYWMGRSSEGLAYYDEVKDTVFNFLVQDNKDQIGAMSSFLDNQNNLCGTQKGLLF